MSMGFYLIILSLILIPDSSMPQTIEDADFNGNGMVDFDDFFLYVDHFGRVSSASNFDARYDLDKNGAIDFDDFFLFADQFGRKQETIAISGIVKALNGKILAGYHVEINKANTQEMFYSITDQNGRYEVNLPTRGSYTVRITGRDIVERVIENIEINMARNIDILDIQAIEQMVSFISNDINQDGKDDELEIVYIEKRQEIKVQDLDFNGTFDNLGEIREYTNAGGTIVTQKTTISESSLGKITSGSLTVESKKYGIATLNFYSEPEETGIAGISGAKTEGEISILVSSLTPKILEINDESVRIEIPKSMAPHINQLMILGTPNITVIEPDPMLVWTFNSLSNVDIESSEVKRKEDLFDFVFQVKTNLPLNLSNIHLEVRTIINSWEIAGKVEEIARTKFLFFTSRYIYNIEASWKAPTAGTYSVTLDIFTDSQDILAKSQKTFIAPIADIPLTSPTMPTGPIAFHYAMSIPFALLRIDNPLSTWLQVYDDASSNTFGLVAINQQPISVGNSTGAANSASFALSLINSSPLSIGNDFGVSSSTSFLLIQVKPPSFTYGQVISSSQSNVFEIRN